MQSTLEQNQCQFRNANPLEDLRELCPNPSLVIDGGAGDGWFAGQARELWPSAEIISFEPATRFNKTLTPIDARHRIVRVALGNCEKVVGLNLTHGPQSNSLLEFLPGGPLERIHAIVGHEQVRQLTLDGYLKKHHLESPQIIKLDVQGTEMDVLNGASDALKSKPLVFCEVAFQRQYLNQPLLADIDVFMAINGYRRLYLYASTMPDIWGDALYVPNSFQTDGSPIRLNIRADDTVIDGFTPIDRKYGTEAFPLDYPDGSVEEIRCVHMLEHLSFKEVPLALKEWNRVLRPGGRLRISVPDVEKVLELAKEDKFDAHWRFYLMGGQTDENDFHKSAFDGAHLAAFMQAAGFGDIQPWVSPNTDLAASDISLNLEGFKGVGSVAPSPEQSVEMKVRAVVGMPRIGWNDSWQSIIDAMKPFNIPIETHQGCFWAQNLQKALERAERDGIDWVITLDYDSVILPMHVARLMEIMGTHPEIDACAALQMRRGQETALLSNGTTEQEIGDLRPIKVNTAHFGLTIIRTECLKSIAKPWFIDVPDNAGGFGGEHVDADINFWLKWKAAGKSIYVAPDVRIGHLELLVSEFDDDMKPRHFHVSDWWNRHAKAGHCLRSKKED